MHLGLARSVDRLARDSGAHRSWRLLKNRAGGEMGSCLSATTSTLSVQSPQGAQFRQVWQCSFPAKGIATVLLMGGQLTRPDGGILFCRVDATRLYAALT